MQSEELGQVARSFNIVGSLLRAEWAKPGAYILGALFYEFEHFAAGVKQEDDLTAVCVKFK